MRRILHLMRHDPVAPTPGRRSVAEAVADYDAAPILPSNAPAPLPAPQRILSSDAPRSIATATAHFGRLDRADPMFREAPLAPVTLPFALPREALFALGRARWLCSRSETTAFGTRIQKALRVLTDETATGPVVLVAHGWFNRSLARELRRAGWVTSGSGSYHCD